MRSWFESAYGWILHLLSLLMLSDAGFAQELVEHAQGSAPGATGFFERGLPDSLADWYASCDPLRKDNAEPTGVIGIRIGEDYGRRCCLSRRSLQVGA